MKKIVMLLTLITAMMMSVNVLAAKTIISVDNGEEKVDIVNSPTKSIRSLIPNLADVKKGETVEQEITVTSVCEEVQAKSLTLRLDLKGNKSSTNKGKSPLDYFNIKIETIDGEMIYDYETDGKMPENAEYKDIELLPLNEENKTDIETYIFTITANDEIEPDSNTVGKIDWLLIVGEDAEDGDLPETSTAGVDVEPQTFNKGTYKVGKDINEGKYEITGESKVKVYTEDGTLKVNISLTKDPDDEDGVFSYVLNLKDGEKVELTDDTEFIPYSPIQVTDKPAVTKKPAATTKPKTTTKPTSSPKATVKPSTSPDPKSNPKTGDNSGMVLFAAMLAVCGLAVTGYMKKKNY